jgi:ABC-type lipoprotein release transport system permease subunit
MSFVALTSFTTGYGLIVNRISNQQFPLNSALIRAPTSELFYTFAPLEITAAEWLLKQSEVEITAPKAESQPLVKPALTLNGQPLYGIIGIHPSVEAEILGFDKILVEGNYLKDGEENTLLISSDLKEKLGVEVNMTLSLSSETVRIVGIYDFGKLRLLNDLDGNSIIPNKLIDHHTLPGEPPYIQVIPVEADELVICGLETALKMPAVHLSRINAVLRDGESANDFAERVALEKNYDVWASSSEGLYLARLGTYFEGKGISLAIPWTIVVLNVVITMLNALYERRKEINILSSVGLNPSHMAGIFIAEALATGLIGGGIGYLLGLNMYKVMAFLNITLEVKQKISAVWSFGAVAIAMTAVIVGAVSALKGSVVITPSLRRKWKIERNEQNGKPLEISLPIRVRKDEIEEFMNYVIESVRSYEHDPMQRTSEIKMRDEDTEKENQRNITFNYRKMGGDRSFSKNRLIVEGNKKEDVYSVKMISEGDSSGIHQAGNIIRRIIMQWSTRK